MTQREKTEDLRGKEHISQPVSGENLNLPDSKAKVPQTTERANSRIGRPEALLQG